MHRLAFALGLGSSLGGNLFAGPGLSSGLLLPVPPQEIQSLQIVPTRPPSAGTSKPGLRPDQIQGALLGVVPTQLIGSLVAPLPGGTPLPNPSPIRRPPPVLPPKPKASATGSYRVQKGDSLSRIARRLCGSAANWKAIYRANAGTIRDPNRIYPGQNLVIPCAGGQVAPVPTPPRDPRSPGTQPPARPPVANPPANSDTGARRNPRASFLTHVPVAGKYRLSSGFGPRKRPSTKGGRKGSSQHKGLDLAAPTGTPVVAAGAGKVVHAGWAKGYGWSVYIKHPNGYVTRYAHLYKRPQVRVGQSVAGGQKIGGVGATGNASGPHLHFEVRTPGGAAKNPHQFCKF